LENELENRIQRLENQIKTLEQWKSEKEKQQIKFPLDNQSIEILNKYFMRIYETVTATGGAGGNTFTSYLGKQGSTYFVVLPDNLIPFTANPTTDYLTVTDSYFTDWTPVYFSTTGTLPAPLDNTLFNFVIESDGLNFKIVTQQGGLISVTAGSDAVVGTGTSFTSLSAGDVIYCGTENKRIDIITDDTHLTTTTDWDVTNTNDNYYLLNDITDKGTGSHYIEQF